MLKPKLKNLFLSPKFEYTLSSNPSFSSLFLKFEKFVELIEFENFFSSIGDLSFFKLFMKLIISLKVSHLLFSKSSYLINNVLKLFVFFQDL